MEGCACIWRILSNLQHEKTVEWKSVRLNYLRIRSHTNLMYVSFQSAVSGWYWFSSLSELLETAFIYMSWRLVLSESLIVLFLSPYFLFTLFLFLSGTLSPSLWPLSTPKWTAFSFLCNFCWCYPFCIPLGEEAMIAILIPCYSDFSCGVKDFFQIGNKTK